MQDSIIHNSNWENFGEVVVPQTSPENFIPIGMKRENVKESYRKVSPATLMHYQDSVTKAKEDSIVWVRNDSIARERSDFGLVLKDPYYIEETEQGYIPSSSGDKANIDSMSWVYALFVLMFCLVAFKSHSTPKYIRQLWRNLTDTRVRHNVFNTTVRESSFMFILNAVWVICFGVILWGWVRARIPGAVNENGLFPLYGVGLCIAVATVYKLTMQLGYLISGNVFTDSRTTKDWVESDNSACALEGYILFPLAILSLIYTEHGNLLGIIGLGVVIVGKLLFIYKGLRIFLSHFASFLLFLYYLCSLEIIPLCLAIVGAVDLCKTILYTQGF